MAANCKADSECSCKMFDPPVYKQRYDRVVKLVKQLLPQKVVDMGCSECSLMLKLIRTEGLNLEELVGVDVDIVSLQYNMFRVKPLLTEYLNPSRDHELKVKLYQGSVSEPDARLKDADMIVGLELIEHLEATVLSHLPDSLFGVLNPKTVVLSTPNADFNVLFPELTGFRHWDHKFEWTRLEFQSWCDNIAKNYNYNVEYGGVGNPPIESSHLGHCTQIAEFTRITRQQRDIASEPYTLVVEYSFPFVKEKLSHEQKVLNEVEYYVNIVGKAQVTDDLDGPVKVNIKLKDLLVFPCVRALCSNVGELRTALLKTDTILFDGTGESVVATINHDVATSDDEVNDSWFDSDRNEDSNCNETCDSVIESWD